MRLPHRGLAAIGFVDMSATAGFPPRIISVPLPAILVATVMAEGLPAWAIMCASRSWCLAF